MNDEHEHLDPIDEELVAYLDGEIDAIGRVRVERRLVEDAAFRQRLKRMQQTWDALDLLPRTAMGDGFTSSTMSLVVTEQEVEATTAVRRLQATHGRRGWLMVLATAAAAAIGFLLIYRRLTSEDQALVDDLPVIERVDQLHNTPSVEFLGKLQKEGLFLADTNEN